MMDNPSLDVINAIKQRIPQGVTLIDFFTEILPMKKEAAYRRLRGEIPLSLQEVRQIASFLHFSLDKLLGLKDTESYPFTIARMNEQNLTSAYCRIVEVNINAMKNMLLDPKSKIYRAINVLPTSHMYKYPLICKFRFFKWVYQCRNAVNPLRLSEIVIPPQVRYYEEVCGETAQQLTTYCVSIKELFAPIVNDIYYFAEMGLVTQEEIALLKEEICLLLDDLEGDISAGRTKYGVPFYFYLANTYFDSNYLYVEGNDYKASAINVFGMNYLSSKEEEICNDTKVWIESLLKYSTLISVSGAIEKTCFFNLQRKILEASNLNTAYGTYSRRIY